MGFHQPESSYDEISHFSRCTCALSWIAAESMLSSHTHCRSVSRIWYAVSPNQLLVSRGQPLMFAGSQGCCSRAVVGEAPRETSIAGLEIS